MTDILFYISRFLRRMHWFLIVATLISGVSITVAMTLPPAYESELTLLVESSQIPDELAQSTVATPAMEQLQIIEQRLMTRDNLLAIAREHTPLRDQAELSPDEIVQAMRAHTRIRKSSGRDQATVMTISFEATQAAKTAAVLNSYLSRILEEDVSYRRERAETTQQFFEQQVEDLAGQLDAKSQQILEFKDAHADALPETLEFRMEQRSNLSERISRIESDLSLLTSQREQLLLIYERTGRVEEGDGASVRSPREERLLQLEAELDQALGVYSEQSPQIQRLRSQIEQVSLQLNGNEEAETPAADPRDAALEIQLSELDSRIATLERQREQIGAEIEALSDSIARTPANAIALGGLERDYANVQEQYNRAVDRLARASTGERIEVLSRGQRVTVVEAPAVPTEPTKPDRMKLAAAGTALGMASGFGLIVLLEMLVRAPRRPEDIVAKFDVMPIATIPYIRTRGQMVRDRALKLFVALLILGGVPAAIYAVHVYYLPLDLLADKVMNKIGVRL